MREAVARAVDKMPVQSTTCGANVQNVGTNSFCRHGTEGPSRLTVRWDLELLEPELIDVTPAPFFTGLDRTGDGMLRRPEMADGMLVF